MLPGCPCKVVSTVAKGEKRNNFGNVALIISANTSGLIICVIVVVPTTIIYPSPIILIGCRALDSC